MFRFNLRTMLVIVLILAISFAIYRFGSMEARRHEDMDYRGFLGHANLLTAEEKASYALRASVGDELRTEVPFVCIRLDSINGPTLQFTSWLHMLPNETSTETVTLTHQQYSDRRFGKVPLSVGGHGTVILVVSECSDTEIEYGYNLDRSPW